MSDTELQAQLAALRLELAQANRRAEEESSERMYVNPLYPFFCLNQIFIMTSVANPANTPP